MRFTFRVKHKNKGFGIVELLVVIGIIGLAMAGIAGFGNYILKVNSKIKRQMAAIYLAQEGIEAIRAIKEESWSLITNLTPNSAYHPDKSGGKWILAANSENINGYTRQIVAQNVNRDANDDIVESGGAADAGTKKIIATVFWSDQGQNYQATLAAYLTDWQP